MDDRELGPPSPAPAPLTEEQKVALSALGNSALQTPYDLLPASVRKKYRGSTCIDATPLRIRPVVPV